MKRPYVRAAILALTLGFMSTGSWASAAPPRKPDLPRAPRAVAVPLDLFSHLWSFAAQWWSKNGCSIDPNGICKSDEGQLPPPSSYTDNGCDIDPNGICAAGGS
jgi:hypothetical protein